MRSDREIILDHVGVKINSSIYLDTEKGYRINIASSPAMAQRVEILNKGLDSAVFIQDGKTTPCTLERAEYLSSVLADFPSPLLRLDFSLEGSEVIGAKDCFILKRSDGNSYWISKESFHLIKSHTRLFHEELGEVFITTIFRDYRTVAGISYPFEQEILEYGQRIKITDVEFNKTLESSLFEINKQPVSASSNKENLVQPNTLPDQYPQKVFDKTGSYYCAVKEMEALEIDFKESPLKNYYYDVLSTNLANAGQYQEALLAKERAANLASTPSQHIDLENYKAVNAVEEISKLAGEHRAIFINEAHHVPQHRAFTHQLLQKLFNQGYRYFAAETLEPKDIGIIEQKERMLSYINEPEYADLIRTAVRIGYKIIPYEQLASEQISMSQDAESNRKSINNREQAQAENLKEKIFDKDAKAKVLVHAGYDHILEQEHMGFEMMAARFKKITGIDPLTIDQVGMMERGIFNRSNPYYKFIIEKLSPEETILLKSSKKHYWTSQDKKGKVDLQIFHPKTHYLNDRASWKSLAGARKAITIHLEAPIDGMAEVFLSGEKNGVPIDRVFTDVQSTSLTFYLPPGDFEIIISDETGLKIKTLSLSV